MRGWSGVVSVVGRSRCPQRRHVVGFVESVAGEEDGVGEEAVEVFEVCCAAFCEVGVGGSDYACGDGGNVSEFGVNGEFAGYDDGGCAGGEDATEPVFQARLPPRRRTMMMSAASIISSRSASEMWVGLA